MKMNIKKTLQGLMLVPALALGVSAVMPVVDSPSAFAQTGGVRGGINEARGDDQPENLFEDGGIFKTIVNTLLFIIGAVSVIMIIFGGFRYVTSGGDSGGVTSAKNTILYAVIGLVVALLGYALVNFVLDSLLGAN